VFVDILRKLPIRHNEFIFFDLGSGKGGALLLASQFPFKEVIGVELSPSLHRIDCRNIQIYRDDSQQCRRIRCVYEDAASYRIPPEKAVFYLFNPFGRTIMQVVLANIEESLKRVPREIYVAYLKPQRRDLFDHSTVLRAINDTDRYVIYHGRLGTTS
jgi:hypothetical protein